MGAHERRWWARAEDTAHLRRCVGSWTPRRRDRDATQRQKQVTGQLDELLEALDRRRPVRVMDIRRRIA